MVLTTMRLRYSHSRPSIHHYTSNDGNETLKQQWMSLHTAHHPISLAHMGIKMCYFASNMRVIFKEMTLFLTIRGSCMPPEALLTILIWERIVVEHSSSNECLSLRKSSTFSGLTFCQTFVFCLKFDGSFHRNDTVFIAKGLRYSYSKSPIILVLPRMAVKHPRSNIWLLFTLHIIPCVSC